MELIKGQRDVRGVLEKSESERDGDKSTSSSNNWRKGSCSNSWKKTSDKKLQSRAVAPERGEVYRHSKTKKQKALAQTKHIAFPFWTQKIIHLIVTMQMHIA